MTRLSSALLCALAALTISSVPLVANAAHHEAPVIASEPETGPHKRALLIGISAYSRKSDPDPSHAVPDLDTAGDIEAIKNILGTKFHFSAKDIKVLTDAKATHEGIIAAFKNLIKQTQPGDIVYFHFSGHGSRVPDPKSVKSDGCTETVVPSDYDFDLPLDKYENEITDVELSDLVQQLDEKKPALAMLTFDCCYSGSIARARAINGPVNRGFQSPNMKLAKPTGNGDNSATQLLRLPRPNIVVIAACRPTEPAQEWPEQKPKMGLFTYALTNALSQTGDKTTYKELLDQIRTTMATASKLDQAPQMDGNPGHIVMSGTAVAVPTTFDVEVINGTLSLNAGQLQGMTAGSTFNIYTNEVVSAQKIATAKVQDVDLLESSLQVESGQEKLSGLKQHQHLRAVESEHIYKNEPMVIALDVSDQSLQTKLANSLSKEEGVVVEAASKSQDSQAHNWDLKITGAPGDLRVVRGDGRSIQLGQASGTTNTSHAAANRQTPEEAVAQSVREESMFKFLKQLHNSALSSDMSVKARVIPAQAVAWNSEGQPTKVVPKQTDAGGSQLTEGDFFQVEVENTGNKTAFLNVFDLEPNGKIAAIYPIGRGKVSNSDSLPPKGKWVIPATFQVQGPAFGNEIIKVIATTERADFSPIVTDTDEELKGVWPTQRSITNPLFRLFAAVHQGTRAPTITNLESTDWSTCEFAMETKPRTDTGPAKANN